MIAGIPWEWGGQINEVPQQDLEEFLERHLAVFPYATDMIPKYQQLVDHSLIVALYALVQRQQVVIDELVIAVRGGEGC